MAIQSAWVSFKIQDVLGVVKTFDDYFLYDDAVATLSSLATYVQATCTLLDAITDGKIISATLKLSETLPAGLKTAAAAGSDVEETGLFTYNTDRPNRAYGEDIPAIAQSILNGSNIVHASGAGQSWVNHQMNQSLAGVPTSSRWDSTFTSVRTAKKTFRKSRKALRRA